MKATLTYHSIDPSGSPISISPEAFALHLRWLTSGKIRVLGLTDLVAHPEAGEDAVAITFDDGFLNARGPVERLLAGGVPVTIFVVSDHVGGTNAWGGRASPGIPTLPLLDWRDLEHLRDRGAAIEAHTRRHPALTTLAPVPGALDDELQGSRDDLLARLGVRSTHVAYPYGDVDEAVAARAALHFPFGHTTDFRVMTDGDSAIRLPRLDMYYFRASSPLESWGGGAFRRRIAWIRARRAIRARLTRRA